MDAAIAHDIIERVVLEQLSECRDELTMGQIKLIADQVAREAWRRLNRASTSGPSPMMLAGALGTDGR